MSHLVAPLDLLITMNGANGLNDDDDDDDDDAVEAEDTKRFLSIGIGDGGNEVGMGKVIEKIRQSQSIAHSNDIGCTVATDYLIVASVSDWGAYALSAAIAVMSCVSGDSSSLISRHVWVDENETVAAPSHGAICCTKKDAIMSCLLSGADLENMCTVLIEAGARDGLTGQPLMMVDGMPLSVSIGILNEIVDCATSDLPLT